jgi:hypothetical protein
MKRLQFGGPRPAPASSLAIFYPGNGRAVYAGLRYAF